MIKILRSKSPLEPWFDALCERMYEWWGEKEGWTQAQVTRYMENSINSCENLPQMLVALDDDGVAGMAQLSYQDTQVYPNIYPWLINLYVTVENRSRGLGKELVEAASAAAKNMGFAELYLYTEHVGFFERFGFQYLGDIYPFIESEDKRRLYRAQLVKGE